MKITEVIIHPLSVDMTKPVWSAHEVFARQQLTLVEVRTDEGITGFGEIWFGPQTIVVDYLKMFSDLVVGMDPRGNADVSNKLFSTTCPRPGGIGGWDGLPPPLPRHHRPQITAAIAGIDNALWDIKGKAANLPVFRLLGGTRTEVFAYATGGFYIPTGAPASHYANELEAFVKKGYRAVKLKAGALSLADEVERVRAVREAIGPDIQLLLDLNAPFDVAACIRYSHAVERYDIFWLEEALHWYLQPEDYVTVANQTSIPLAHGEREMHRFSARDFMDSGSLAFIQFDSTRHMGFTEALRVAEHAALKNVKIAPHAAPHLHGHLISAFGDAAYAAEFMGVEYLHPIHSAVYAGQGEVKNGMMQLTEAPGWGFEVDFKQMERFRI